MAPKLWPQTTQNRQVHAKQEVGQLYFIIHNNIIYFWEIEWISIQNLINHPIQKFPYKVFIYACINCVTQTLSLGCLWTGQTIFLGSLHAKLSWRGQTETAKVKPALSHFLCRPITMFRSHTWNIHDSKNNSAVSGSFSRWWFIAKKSKARFILKVRFFRNNRLKLFCLQSWCECGLMQSSTNR